MKLQYNKDTFLLDGKPFRILSGAIHYFRVPEAYWEDRLRKLRACGFNTVETYCCWNLHEKQEGSFDFSGMLNIRRFLETAQNVGLYAIVRPGPFICAEIDNGGLPYWLNRFPMRLRCSDPLFLEKTRTYFARLFEELRPMLAEQGGNILALQIENEYGSYGNDADYLRALAGMYQENGAQCLFFTSDGPTDFMLTSGTLPEYPATCNFGSRGARAWETLQAQHPASPSSARNSGMAGLITGASSTTPVPPPTPWPRWKKSLTRTTGTETSAFTCFTAEPTLVLRQGPTLRRNTSRP